MFAVALGMRTRRTKFTFKRLVGERGRRVAQRASVYGRTSCCNGPALGAATSARPCARTRVAAVDQSDKLPSENGERLRRDRTREECLL